MLHWRSAGSFEFNLIEICLGHLHLHVCTLLLAFEADLHDLVVIGDSFNRVICLVVESLVAEVAIQNAFHN